MTRKTITLLTCALALFAVSPATGFTQSNTETTLGDVGPSIEATRLLVATDVTDREPVGTATEFSIAGNTHLFAFVEVSNQGGEETEVTVSLVNNATGATSRSFVLPVGPSKRWRTWARAAAPREPGAWSVVLTDSYGNELARTDFTMVQ